MLDVVQTISHRTVLLAAPTTPTSPTANHVHTIPPITSSVLKPTTTTQSARTDAVAVNSPDIVSKPSLETIVLFLSGACPC